MEDYVERARQIYNLVYPWIPNIPIRRLVHQITSLFSQFMEDPTDIQGLLPSLLSTLFLAFSLYWTITSALTWGRRAYRFTIFFVKYGAIFYILLSGLGYLSPGMTQQAIPQVPNLMKNVASYGWNALTNNDNNANPGIWSFLTAAAGTASPPSSRRKSQTTTPKSTKYKKPWERFDEGSASAADSSSSNTRSKAKTTKKTKNARESGSSSESQWGGFASGDGAGGGGISQFALKYAIRKVWNIAQTTEWPVDSDILPDDLKRSWEQIKSVVEPFVTAEDDDDEETRSR